MALAGKGALYSIAYLAPNAFHETVDHLYAGDGDLRGMLLLGLFCPPENKLLCRIPIAARNDGVL